MTETDAASQTPGVPLESAPSPASQQENISEQHDEFENVPILPPHMRQPDSVPETRPLDATLDEGDLKLSLNVTINGRMVRIMDCTFTSTACGALDAKNRGIVFKCLDQLTEQALQAAAVKLNSVVPLPEPSPDEMQDGSNPGLLNGARMSRALAGDGMIDSTNGAPRP